MRVKLWLALSALVLLVALAASTAGGAITSVSGEVELISAPASVELGALTSDTTMRAFDERQCVRLDADLTVDINAPGKYNEIADLPDPKPVIAAGTYISSHFVHTDTISGTRNDPIDLEGAIVTSDEILGIVAVNQTLNDSDFLGAPGTVYPKDQRGINFGPRQNDFVLEQVDLKTVVIHAENHEHADQVRVITKCTSPPKKKCKIAGIGILSTNYKAGFAFLIETSQPAGGLLYADKLKGKTLVSNTITSVDLVGSTATVQGTGKVNGGATVSFTMVVTDNGYNDSFAISWPGYSASGDVKKGEIVICCP